jgi:hypothetical protein
MGSPAVLLGRSILSITSDVYTHKPWEAEREAALAPDPEIY